MKIALPITKDHRIDDHFGHCEYYGIYTISEENTIKDYEIVESTQGCGCKSNIAAVLAAEGVTVMLAGGIGAGAINVLNHHGIEVIRGCTGNAAQIVKLFLEGQLTDSGESCQHHEHHHPGDHHGHHHKMGHDLN